MATTPSLCPSNFPLLLLPVRLETRFFSLPGNVTELRVRIYPDKIHLDSHEPDLLPTERDWGAHYWELDWRAGNDATARATAWRQLADRFGAERAAWIARALQPTNPAQRPTAPVPPNAPLPVAPQLPTVTVVTDGRDSAWRHAPQARLLPDRWIAVLKSGATAIQVTGRDIAKPLAVGPNPQAPTPTTPPDVLPVDPGMKWMVDFDEAEAKGMALRITVPPASAAGLDTLLVYGVAASVAGTDAPKQLADLLDAHHYTDGLEFLRFGTPTNNTDDRRAAAAADDAQHQRSFAIEVASDPATLDPRSNAVRVGTALGLAASTIGPVLGRIGQAADSHELDMRSMNAALWQVGWGYYLSNMVGFDGTGLTPPILAWARDHFVTLVRSGGPYPLLRCGRQPYGLLPVTSLTSWQPRPGDEQALANDSWLRTLLQKLRDNIWRPRLADVFRVGRRQADPDSDLADVMRTDGLASGYGARAMLGRHYLQHLRAFMGEDLQGSGFISTQDALAAGILQRLGIAWRPRLARTIGADGAWPVSAPLVQAGEVSPWRGLEPNYIAGLLAAGDIATVIQTQPDPANASLLQLLLRHALLRELADAAAAVAAAAPGSDAGALLRDAELINLVTDAPPTATWKKRLDDPAPGITGNPTIRQYLQGLATFDAPAVAALGDFRRSLTYLQGRDSEALQYLMQGTLDLSSHRLDAWITSFATKRLATMTASGPQGVYVGAYGWVEQLRPTPSPSVLAATQLPAGEPAPLVMRTNDGGFIHAPSMTQAAAAALLRNAHLGASNMPAPDSPFAIDVSSRRAREAARLLDGVRQGQPLGALLGFRVERSLHDVSLDAVIPRLRKLAPLAAAPPAATQGATAAIAANNVVDGLALSHLWQADRTATMNQLQPTGPGTHPLTTDEQAKIGHELDALADAVDGLSDALTAEAAYQMARGNTSRVASTVTAVSQGDAPPPELEVIRTPRSGVALTHRLLVLFSGLPVATTGWPGRSASARAAAEPMLNAWAAKLLGNGSKVRCTIERLDATGAVVETQKLTLAEVSITPLDVVYGVETTASATQADGALSETEQRVLYHAKHRTGGFDPQANIRLQHARPTDLAVGETTLFDVLEQARATWRLLSGMRGADSEDLNPPERTDTGTIDLTDLQARVVAAENALNAAHKQTAALLAKPATLTAEALRTALLKLGVFGITGAIPAVASGESPAAVATLSLQAAAVMKTSAARLDQGTALRLIAAATDQRARRDQLVERMRAVFGKSFVVLPRFTCAPAAAAELTSALAASKVAQGGDPLAVHGWFARYARIRDTVARMSACLRGADVLGTGERLNLSVAQLPLVSGERWVGLPADPAKPVSAGKLSLVLQMPAAIDTTQPMTGLLVDEWTETVPSTRETTAITFQFDPPDAGPPQSILIAVPPVPGVDWTADSLRQVLEETLDLAKLRAVDAETLGETAQYLPALYLAFNAKDDVVSSDFAPLTR